jgi:hypothetical protein
MTTTAAATAADELKARKAKIAFVVYGYLSLIMCGYGIMFQLELARRHQIEVEQRAQYIERLRTSLKAALMEEEIMEDDNPAPRKKRRPSRYNNDPVPFNMAAVPPPNIANAAANLAVNTDAPIAPADPMILQQEAARAAKGRRIIESLADGIQVTDVESDAVVYEHQTAVAPAAAAPLGAIAAPPDAPAWAGPLFVGINKLNNTVNNMNNTLNNLANTVNAMNNTVNNLTNTVNSMNNRLSNVEARSLNNAVVSMAQDDTTLTPLSNAAGNNIPANFSPTLGALNAMNSPDLTAFASALWAAQQRRARGIAQPSTTILPEVDWNPSVNGFGGHTFTAEKRSREPQQQKM